MESEAGEKDTRFNDDLGRSANLFWALAITLSEPAQNHGSVAHYIQVVCAI
jgi:hypothetical protein